MTTNSFAMLMFSLLSGAGGRDLSGNKRTSEQAFDQELTKTNLALAVSCDAAVNDKDGAEAKNWQMGKPIRVLRCDVASRC